MAFTLLLANIALANNTILVVGDSLSAAYQINPNMSWVKLLEKRLISENYPYQVVNISESGATSSRGVTLLQNAIKSYHPNIVIIGLGSNDGLRGLPTEALQNNLIKMVDLSQKSEAQVLLVGFLIPYNYGRPYRQKFEQVFIDVATKYKLHRVPFLLDKFAEKSEFFLEDGLHPNEAAQSLILDTLWPYLKVMLLK